MNKALREDLKLWHLVLGFVVFALGGAVSLGMTYQKINDRLDDYEQKERQLQGAIIDFGVLFHKASQDIEVTKRDVEWIRRELEKK